jgi:putative membrane protein
MECVLTNKALKVKKGIFTKIEKTIPLEKITDMGMVQGPIMRKFDLYTLTVETAGQSGQGALVSLTGIVGAKNFRETVLARREALSESSSPATSERPLQATDGTSPVLEEIRDALLRIEENLKASSTREL